MRLAWLAGNWWILAVVWLVLNVATWAVYRRDKALAHRGGRRISEQTLLLLALAGGWVGALGAVYLHRQRHKAQKRTFLVPLFGIIGLWLIVVLAGLWWLARQATV